MGYEIDGSKSAGNIATKSTTQSWFGQQNYVANTEETEKEKLQKGNVWDYARNMQAGSYLG